MTDTTDPYDSPPPDWQTDDGEVFENLDYHARKARQHQDELLRLEHVYMREMDRIRDRYDERRAIIQKRIDWHTAPIESYHRAHPKQRTIELPNGTAKLTVPKTAKVFTSRDETERTALEDWARRAHPEIMSGPNITDVRKVVTITDDGKVVDPETGEVVPGCTAEVPDPTWSIDLAAGAPF